MDDELISSSVRFGTLLNGDAVGSPGDKSDNSDIYGGPVQSLGVSRVSRSCA
jgi:hypothetical protein